jgi:four helix bundle protein
VHKAIRSYKDLIVYQKAYQLSLHIYRLTESYPKAELYGLVSQMRRSAVSIPANIAEGYRRGHRKEYVQFLRIAQGSCGELETFVSMSKDLGFINEKEFEILEKDEEEISRLLQALISSLTIKKI